MRKLLFLIIILNCIVSCTKIDYDFLMREKDGDNKDIIKWILPFMGGGDNSKKIVADKTISEISEGSQVELGITLSKAPSSATRVSIFSSNSSLQTNTKEIEFDSQNYNKEQTIIIKAVEDTNNTDEDVTIEFTADGYESLSFPIDIIDNDNSFILAYNSPASIDEGKSSTFRVKLSIQPKEDKTVNISSSDTTSLQVANFQAPFTPDNYATEQTITVSAPEDSDFTSETVYITLSAKGSASVNIPIKIIDNDIKPVFSVSNLSINELDSQTLGVTLSGDPGRSVDIHLQSSNVNSLTSNTQQLTFNSNNWNTPQSVTLTAPHDDNSINEQIQLSAGGLGISTSYLSIEVIDDELQTILVSGANQVMEGQFIELDVKLSQAIQMNTTVSFSISNSLASVYPASVTFAVKLFYTKKNKDNSNHR